MAAGNRDPSLFDDAVPEGFIYREGVLSVEEERELIDALRTLHLAPFRYYRFTGKRRTISFGWEYEFGDKTIHPAPDIPAFLLPVRERVGKLFAIDPSALAHASIIEYPPGAPIGWHRDVPHFGLVAGVSLSAPCRMRFRKYPPGRGGRAEILSMELQPRSAYLMSGAARESWQHSVAPLRERRYAIMLRTLRTGARLEE